MSTQEQEKIVARTAEGEETFRDASPTPSPADDTASAPEGNDPKVSEKKDAARASSGDSPEDVSWEDFAAMAKEADDKAQSPVPATASAGGDGGSLPPKTTDMKDDDVPALPEEDDEEGAEEEGEGGRMSLMDHLRELRTRILYSLAAVFVAFLACWAVVEPVFNVLTKPLLDVLPAGSTAMYTTLPEAFFTRMYIAFIVGLFAASPFIFYQIWSFISPGLYEEEKHFILPIAFISALFFIAGGLFCYYIVFKYAFAFFVSFATEDIVAMPKISDYLDFVLKLVLAFGFIFEMPIFSFFLSRMGIVTARKMREVRRYAVLVIFIVAAILTPPDVVSQLLMAVPMLILYEVSIIVALIFGKKEEEKPQEEEEADDEDYDEDYADEDYADEADEPVKRQETATAPARQDSAASAAPASAPSGTPSAAPAARPAASATAQEQVPGTGTAGQDGEQAPAQKS